MCYLARKVYGFQYDEHIEEQDLVFSVELHLGFTPYPLSLPLVPHPVVLFLSRKMGVLVIVVVIVIRSKSKVNS